VEVLKQFNQVSIAQERSLSAGNSVFSKSEYSLGYTA